jgi:hypothetical protein
MLHYYVPDRRGLLFLVVIFPLIARVQKSNLRPVSGLFQTFSLHHLYVSSANYSRASYYSDIISGPISSYCDIGQLCTGYSGSHFYTDTTRNNLTEYESI